MPQDLIRKFIKNKQLSYSNLKTKSKNFVITNEMIDNNILVYTGKNYYTLKVKHDMIGYKIGEFLNTRAVLKKRLKKRSKYRRKRKQQKKKL